MKLLLYCTKQQKPKLVEFVDEEVKKGAVERFGAEYNRTNEKYYKKILNGKIVGECEFVVERINVVEYPDYAGADMQTKTLSETQLLERSCLSQEELYTYLDRGGVVEDYGYAIHIKNLVIYDKPRELNELGVKGERVGDTQYFKTCEKAPQNMVCVLDGVEKKILISIRPEWLCKILNGEKTIEVRKKVLKEMLCVYTLWEL